MCPIPDQQFCSAKLRQLHSMPEDKNRALPSTWKFVQRVPRRAYTGRQPTTCLERMNVRLKSVGRMILSPTVYNPPHLSIHEYPEPPCNAIHPRRSPNKPMPTPPEKSPHSMLRQMILLPLYCWLYPSPKPNHLTSGGLKSPAGLLFPIRSLYRLMSAHSCCEY